MFWGGATCHGVSLCHGLADKSHDLADVVLLYSAVIHEFSVRDYHHYLSLPTT